MVICLSKFMLMVKTKGIKIEVYENHYIQKLVRDKIPEIIEASGKKCEIQVVNDDAYLKMIGKMKLLSY